jgi:hypothetical protein
MSSCSCVQYKNPETTRKDVVNAVQQYKSLVPKFEPFGKYCDFLFTVAFLFIY